MDDVRSGDQIKLTGEVVAVGDGVVRVVFHTSGNNRRGYAWIEQSQLPHLGIEIVARPLPEPDPNTVLRDREGRLWEHQGEGWTIANRGGIFEPWSRRFYTEYGPFSEYETTDTTWRT